MNITETIKKLEQIRSESGDIEVLTDDYAGGDDVLHYAEPRVVTDDSRAFSPVVVMRGEGRY